MFSSCFGSRKRQDGDHEALLPQYNDETALQRELHQKMHTYQMLRALGQGFMPSNEQVIVNLRSLLASDFLNPDNPDLSDSGRKLVRYTKQWMHEFIDLLLHKNSDDLIQDFIWFLLRARVEADVQKIASRGAQTKLRSDARAAYESVRTVGSLLLTNSDFRIFLGDMGTIGKQVFADTAVQIRDSADLAAKAIEPSEAETKAISQPGADKGAAPSGEDLKKEAGEVATVVADGVIQSGAQAVESLKENVSGDQKATVLNRLKAAIGKLRQRPDYSESVSTIGILVQRYLETYTRPIEEAVDAAQKDIHANDELDRAAQNLWKLASSFGSEEEWQNLEKQLKHVMRHSEEHPEFNGLMADVGTATQKMLQDPSFWDSADQELDQLASKTREMSEKSSVREDLDNLLAQIQRTFRSVLQDTDVAKLLSTTWKLASTLSPEGAATNPELLDDALHIFIPLVIQAIQYLPIPRLEVSTPDVDLLLENLIVEPGRTVNHSSFLPYRLAISTQNDVEIRKARHRATTSVSTAVTIKLDGLSLRADEIGFWLRAHSGLLLRFADQGIASFELDERGIDIHVDAEVGRDRMDSIVSLRDVRVRVHHLDYKLRKSRLAWLGWLLKPLLRPVLRRTVEAQVAGALADFFKAANRELLYARERLRATRIADPNDVATFVRAVAARLTPADDPDVQTVVGVKPSVFKGVYAPGSVVKLWEEQAAQVEERIEDFASDGWRNGIFDVQGGSGMNLWL